MDKNLKMPNVNPFEYPTIKCTCGNEIFVPGVIFKDIPGIVMAETENVQFPIKVFYCAKCGKLSSFDEEMLKKYSNQSENNSTIQQSTAVNKEPLDIIV